MRLFLIGLIVMAMGEIAAHAQPTPQPAAPPKPAANEADQAKRLDEILKGWSARTLALKSFSATCTRTDKDPLTKKETVFQGEILFQRPNLVKIELVNKANKEDFEKIFFKEKYLFNYVPKEKLVMVHELPPTNPIEENMILSILRGMKPEDAKKRFTMSLQKEKKENEPYAYILISPKTAADQQDLVQAQLAIWIKKPPDQPNIEFMPARFWYREPNKKEVTYLFTDIVPNAELAKAKFVPTKPQGWEVKYANAPQPKGPQPAPIIRNQIKP